MDDVRFWEIIGPEGQGADDDEMHLAAIRGRLLGLPPAELVAFQAALNGKLAESYDWGLWGAAYLINGGCSDDGFDYFRAWLIGRGQEIYEAALRDPDSLAGVADPDRDDHEFEDLWSVAREVYREQTGEEMPADGTAWPSEPKGEGWDFDDDDEVARRLPRLAAIHL